MRIPLRSVRGVSSAAMFLGVAAAVWAIALFLGLAAAVLCVQGKDVATMAERTSAVAGFVVGVDPETGALAAPSAEAMARLAAPATAAGGPRPAPVVHANGMVSLDVRGWMREYSVAVAAPGGSIRPGCITGEREALRAVTASAAPPWEER